MIAVERYVTAHCLEPVLVQIVENSWNVLWATTVGGRPLREVTTDAQVVGKLFQDVMTHQLRLHDARWRKGGTREPDFVRDDDPDLGFELKMCGQPKSREIFGNRCTTRPFASSRGKFAAETRRSTWLLAINYTYAINIVRFGRVSVDDWLGQRASSGNAAKLARRVYETQLRVLPGDYKRRADPRILRGRRRVGPDDTVGSLADAGDLEAMRFLSATHYI